MKLAFSLAVLVAAVIPQTPDAVATLHITAKVRFADAGAGSTEIYYEPPGRFVEETDTVLRGGVSPGPVTKIRPEPYDPQTAIERLAKTPDDLSSHDLPYNSFVGIANGEPLLRGRTLDSHGFQTRQQFLNAAHRSVARIAIPLFGGADGVVLKEQRDKDLVFVDQRDAEWKLTLDQSGRPATLTWHVVPSASASVHPQAPEWVSTFSDYRRVAGNLTWPHRIVTTIEGQPYEELTIKRYEINAPIPMKVFRRW